MEGADAAVLGTRLARGRAVQAEGDDVDPRRVRLQLRLIETLMRAARPAERKGMQERATKILEAVAVEIEPTADAELAQLLARTRAEVEGPGR